jgi:hypothetical protein
MANGSNLRIKVELNVWAVCRPAGSNLAQPQDDCLQSNRSLNASLLGQRGINGLHARDDSREGCGFDPQHPKTVSVATACQLSGI